MGGFSGDRGPAPVAGKPWGVADGRSGDGPTVREATMVVGRNPPQLLVSNHEEAKAQEGQVGHLDINRVSVTRTDFHEDEGPEDEKRHRAEVS